VLLPVLLAVLSQPPVLECRGSVAPTIVLHVHPAGASVDFARLRDELAHEHRTCLYAPGSPPADLNAALARAGEKPPFVFVGTDGDGVAVRSSIASIPLVLLSRAEASVLFPVPLKEAIFDVIEAARTGASLPLIQRDLAGDRHECVDISSRGRLRSDSEFAGRLPRGLELHLSPGEIAGWDLSITRKGSRDDFMWVVTPPFRTAPQRMIGAGYGMTAAQSVQFDRELRFVLNQRDYNAALKVYESELASESKMAKFRALGKGLLMLRFTGHKTAADGSLEWIEFTGRACVPR
jgi:hypothetical protein